MLIESVAIIVVITTLIFMMVRAGRRDTATAVLPLLIVPAAYLFSVPVSHLLRGLMPRTLVGLVVTLVGLVVACVLFGSLCGNFATRRVRRVYLLMCSGFSTILALVLVLDLLK